MLTLELLQSLRSDTGGAALRVATAHAAEPLRALAALREIAPPELARAALEQARLRRRAAKKFARAERMFFTADLLEQASGEETARWRARRYAGLPEVVDLGCGLGGDALALAAAAERVIAVDRDPLALALTRANAEVYAVAERLETRLAAAPEEWPRAAAAFADPSRRPAGRRVRGLEAMSPPFSALLRYAKEIGAVGVKLSPAVAHAELDAALGERPHEREFVSVGGELREAVVWLGELRQAERRAARLPEGISLDGSGAERAEVRPPGAVLYEPDAAVLRAGLVGRLAEELEAWQVDPDLAYLSADAPRRTAWARAYAVRKVLPFSARALARRLRELGAGDVVLKTRGFAAAPETLRRRLAPALKAGSAAVRPVVFVTRIAGRAVMIMGEPLNQR